MLGRPALGGCRMTDADRIVVERDLMVPARDGVVLATDVYRPAGPGPFPVLLERTPYDKSAPSRSERTAAVARPSSRAEVAAYFVGHGYAVTYQDCRGRYHSGGHFTKYLSEAEDGCDALAWLLRQPWCTGRIGTFGLSDRCTDVPIVHLSGWYDPYARTAMENYVGLSRAKRSRMQLILGPWTHGDRSLSHAGEVEFGPAAPVDGNLAADFFELRRRWFDRWLKGLANGVYEEPPVRVFVMGGGSGRRNRDGRLEHGGRWRSAAEWPLPQTRWTRLYLHADRSLAAEAAAGSGAVDYAFDPHDPAPTVGGAISSGEPVMHAGAFDQSATAPRSDVLVFGTP